MSKSRGPGRDGGIHNYSLRQDRRVKSVLTNELSALPRIFAENLRLKKDLFFLRHEAMFWRGNFLNPSVQKTSKESLIIGIRQ